MNNTTCYLIGGPADLTKVMMPDSPHEIAVPVVWNPYASKFVASTDSDFPFGETRRAIYRKAYRTHVGLIYIYDREER